MSIISPAIKSYFKLRGSGIDQFILAPVDTQQQVFNDLIGSAQFTEFGKHYGFGTINSVADFKRQVPVGDYDTLKPFINRILEGAQNVLWPSPISWFAKSSGTTSDKSKFIPISKECLDDNHYKAGKDVLALYLRSFPQSGMITGKCLVVGGSHQVNQLNADSFYGDLSAVMLQNMPWVGQVTRTPDLSIALMDEWEEKIEAIAQTTINEDVTFIAGVPTWTLVLLKRILEIAGTDDIRQVWPNLELYIHGGVSFRPYREQFRRLLRFPGMQYWETYNASEGFFAASDEPDRDDMLLFLNHGIFYEFMPVDEYGKDDPQTLSLQEVQTGVNYAPVISTNTGLWRYCVGDTVKFTTLDPYRIQVTGRLKFFINAFGEEVIVDNTDHALAEAGLATGAQVSDYSVAPIYMSEQRNGAHEWLIEFAYPPADLAEFTAALDRALKAVNSDYEAKRHRDIALSMPVVHVMPEGGFHRWLKHKGKLGGQHKVPRLSNDRSFMEEMLVFAK